MLKKCILLTGLLALTGCSSVVDKEVEKVDMLVVLNNADMEYKKLNPALQKYCVDEEGQINYVDTVREVYGERFLCNKDRVSWVREPIKRKY